MRCEPPEPAPPDAPAPPPGPPSTPDLSPEVDLWDAFTAVSGADLSAPSLPHDQARLGAISAMQRWRAAGRAPDEVERLVLYGAVGTIPRCQPLSAEDGALIEAALRTPRMGGVPGYALTSIIAEQKATGRFADGLLTAIRISPEYAPEAAGLLAILPPGVLERLAPGMDTPCPDERWRGALLASAGGPSKAQLRRTCRLLHWARLHPMAAPLPSPGYDTASALLGPSPQLHR